MRRAGTYDLVQEFGKVKDDGYLQTNVHWILAIIRIGMPLSFSRAKMASVTKDVTQGALLRADKPLVITDDCVGISIQAAKRDHLTHLSATLLQTNVNYLVEVLPGDHVFGWMMHEADDFERVLININAGQPSNAFDDGFKFMGRVREIDKELVVAPDGSKHSSYSLQCVGFSELDSSFFYDNSLASQDQIGRDLGQWLARMGLHIQDLFADATGSEIPPNNINVLIPTLLDLIVGKGPPSGRNSAPLVPGASGPEAPDISATPQTLSEPPYAYLIPSMVGSLLGKSPSDASKPSKIMSYADVLELVQGGQSYSNKNNNTFQIFTPDLSSSSTAQRKVTTTEMLGTFLPFMPEFTNRPLWQVFQQYLNPVVNEMYTALRVNPEGRVVPTIVLRQIPFTTEAFEPSPAAPGPQNGATNPTRFLDLPRWIVPTTAVRRIRVGRSDATRVNFVHVYGSSAAQQNSVPVQYQLVNNPPIRDDLDIQRSGMRPYMATVECFVNDQVGKAPGEWMALIADWMIGSQYTLTGNMTCFGIQSPICPGDNFEFDGVVYHIESVAHQGQIDGNGNKSWTTSFTFTNGMRAEGSSDTITTGGQPIYPGFTQLDNTSYDPGLTLEHRATTGGDTKTEPSDETPKEAEGSTQLNPDDEVVDWATPYPAVGGYINNGRK